MSARFRQFVVFAFGCGLISLVAPMASAQQAQPKPLPKDFDVKGEYDGIQGSYMICILNGNRTLVRFDQKSKIKVTGTATVDFLEKGLFVRFKGVFDRKGKSTEPIKEIVIFTPGPDTVLAAEEGGAGNAFDETGPKKKAPPSATVAYDVAGRITAAHNNLLSIDCGRKKLRAEVAPDAKVTLDATDPTLFASSGDIVKIKGTMDQPPHNVALALDVSIKLATQLAPRKKHSVKVADKTGGKVADKTTDKTGDKTTDKTGKGDATSDKDDKKGADPKAGDGKAIDKTTDKTATGKAADAKKPDDKAADPAK